MIPAPEQTEPATAPAPEAARYAAWGAWFTHEFTRRATENREVVALLNEAGAGGRYKSSDITQWKKGEARPGEAGAELLAAAWRLPAHVVLEAAGYTSYARFAEHRDRTRRAGDPLLARIRESGLPESDQRSLEEDVATMEELIALKIEKLLRGRAQAPTPPTRENAS